MKKLTYLIIGILSTILLFSQCNKPPFFYADPYNSVNFYFVNKTNEKCYVELICYYLVQQVEVVTNMMYLYYCKSIHQKNASYKNNHPKLILHNIFHLFYLRNKS